MFCDELVIELKRNGMKSKELALSADLTEGYLTDIKKGRALPKEEKLLNILNSLNLDEERKNDLYRLWAKETSPKKFVENFEKIEKENKILKELISAKEYRKIEKIQNDYEEKIKKLEIEKKEYQKYKTLLFLLPKEDRIFFVKKILKDIENNLKISGKKRILEKELLEIKDILKKI